MSHHRIILFWPVIALLVTAAVLLSFLLTVAKEGGLAYHTRDYAFYLDIAVRAFDADYPREVTQNPNGYNVFRFVGVEAVRNLHQGVHFEPGKYAAAALYALFSDTRALYAWYAALFFAPLFYFAFRARRYIPDGLVLLCAALYVAFPSALPAPANDLRPFILMAPALLFALTAFALDRSRGIRLCAFAALLLVREEGLLFAFPLVLIPFLEGWWESGWRTAVRDAAPFAALWLAVAALMAAYFAWTGYENILVPSLEKHAVLLGVAAVAAAGGAYAAWTLRRRLAPLLSYALYAAPLAFVVLQFALSMRVNGFTATFFHPYFMTAVAAFLPLAILLLSWSPRAHRAAAAALAVAVFAAASFSVSEGFVAQYREASTRIPDAALVRAVARDLQSDGYVMTDYDTHQAFFAAPRLFNYERLPASSMPAGTARYWPANEAQVRDFLAATDLIVVSARSMPVVRELTGGEFVVRASNDSYAVFRRLNPAGE